MEKETTGIVISVATQWWLKVNTKPVRKHALDGATFPHIIKVQYTVDGKAYIKRKWIGANSPVPAVGSAVTVFYWEEKPGKAKVLAYQGSGTLRKDQQEENEQTYYMPIGMCIGMALGVAIGSATGNLGTYMPIGLCIGLCVGVLLDTKRRKETKDTPQSDKE